MIRILNEAGHILIVIIREVIIIIVVGVPAEGHDVGAIAELHVGVGESGVALEKDLLTRDLLLARHLANLENMMICAVMISVTLIRVKLH